MKIATLNLRHNVDRWEGRFPLIVETLAHTDADVIGLQEVWLEIQQAHLIADALNQQSQSATYEVYVVPKWGPQPVEGIAILTRLSAVEHAILNLPGEGYRIAQWITIEVDGQALHIANTHLHHRPALDDSIRLPQMKQLLHWMFEHDSRHWLLTGDMNALPESATIQAALESLQSAYLATHGQHPVTFPTPLVETNIPDVCIDHILYDPQTLQPTNAQVIGDHHHPEDTALYPSDHYGLVAEFKMR
jgi:endonuclease/exonuclease/phosphatase family metal-dependent hydrolase